MSKTTLYSIADEYRTILDSLEDGELDDATRARLDSVERNLTDKAQNVAAFIRNNEELAKSIKAAEAAMRNRRQAIEARVRWLKEYLLENMEKTGVSKIECPWFKIQIRNNPKAVQVDNVIALPDHLVRMTIEMTREDYLRVQDAIDEASYTVVSTQVDKPGIKDRLVNGIEVKGAELTQTKRVQIA